MSHLQVRLDHASAHLPTKGSADAAGYDLYSVVSAVIPGHGGRVMLSTGIAVTVPEGTYGRIAPRSGLAVKAGIDVLAGVIDRDYTDTIRVILINHGVEPYMVHSGDRVAQLILEKIAYDVLVVLVPELESTARGSGGFGSTG